MGRLLPLTDTLARSATVSNKEKKFYNINFRDLYHNLTELNSNGNLLALPAKIRLGWK
jgi:hypothetical protein